MDRRRRRSGESLALATSLATIIIAGLWSDLAHAACDLDVRASRDPPYFLPHPNGVMEGVGADTLREALRRSGCGVTFVEMPFARAMASLEDGTVGVVSNVFRTEERARFAYFSAPYNKVPNRLFVRRVDVARWHIEKLADLIGTDFRLGSQINVVYSPEFRILNDDPRFQRLLVPVSDRDALWQMLAMDRIDGVIADEWTAIWELREAGLTTAIVPQGFIATADPSYVAFSRKRVSAELVTRFDTALAAMRRDGTLAGIFDRYHLPRSELDPEKE